MIARCSVACLGAVFAVMMGAPSTEGAAGPPKDAERANLAAGREVRFAPAPAYAPTAEGGTDATDLTDGELTRRKDSKIWRDPRSVTWRYAGRVNLAVDLGEPADIGEVAIRLLGGSDKTGIASWVEVMVSGDGEHWREVDEFSRWDAGAFTRFDVPDQEGEEWIHRLRFRGLNVRARWVGLRLYGSTWNSSDEMYVLGKEGAAPGRDASEAGQPSGFSVSHPQPYFHKPELLLTNNVTTPLPVGLVKPEHEAAEGPVVMELDVPEGVELRSGSIGETSVADARGEPLPGGGRRYRFEDSRPRTDKVFGRLYARASGWRDGRTGTLRYRFRHAGWSSGELTLPLRARRVPPAPRLRTIVAGLTWWHTRDSVRWPHVLRDWRRLGLNTFPAFGRYMPDDRQDDRWRLLEKARKRGFKILNIAHPYRMLERRRSDKKEIFCQLENGEVGDTLCPSYRGKYYREEVERFADLIARVRPDHATQDIELWHWSGPRDSERCTRCQADFARSGLDSREKWLRTQGDEMWRNLIAAARRKLKRVGGRGFETGGYDFRPGKVYDSVFAFDRLYPGTMDTSQVSTYTALYPYQLAFIGDEVRADRRKLPHSDVIPWLTPGDAGTFPGRAFQWSLLEALCNGARGFYFWSGRLWDAEDLLAFNRVVRAIQPVEAILVEGRLAGDAAAVNGPGRISGMRRGDQMVLLVADYTRREPRRAERVRVRLNVKRRSAVRDLLSGRVLEKSIPPGEHELSIPLNGEAARLLHVAPIGGG